jgi:hypothetical protein
MPLLTLLLSFLVAAFLTLVFCVLKFAFNFTLALSDSALRLRRRRPTIGTSSAVPNSKSVLKGSELRKGLKVSFEPDRELRDILPGGLDADADLSITTMRDARTGAKADGLSQRWPTGRKLSIVTEE